MTAEVIDLATERAKRAQRELARRAREYALRRSRTSLLGETCDDAG